MSYHPEPSSFQRSRRPLSPKTGAAALSDHELSRRFPPRESANEGTEVGNRENMAGKFSGLNAGNFSAENGRPRAFHMTQREWRELSSEAFRSFVGQRPGGAKVIAYEVECSPKTAQSWLDGESTPAGLLDLRAMNRIPAYAALKREIAAMESDMDPRLQAKYAELHRLTLELAGER